MKQKFYLPLLALTLTAIISCNKNNDNIDDPKNQSVVIDNNASQLNARLYHQNVIYINTSSKMRQIRYNFQLL